MRCNIRKSGEFNLDIRKLNAFKNFDCSPLKYKACVGNNSAIALSERDLSIFQGFNDTVELLYKNIGENKIMIDVVVYPFMFSCRHSIEILLKYLIRHLCFVKSMRYKQNYDGILNLHLKVLRQHNIELLVNDLISLLDVDRRLKSYIKTLNEYERVWDEFFEDDKGDTYRYTLDTDENAHLKDKHLIALDIIYKKYKIITSILVELVDKIYLIINEYRVGTFTAELSRNDIEEIAMKLPDKRQWVLDSFDIIRESIYKEYGISHRELSRAINIIEAHNEFCTHIGMEIPYRSFNKDTLQKTAQLIKMYDAHEQEKPMPKEKYISISDIEYDENFYKSIYEIASTIPKEDMVMLFAFIEVGAYDYYSEEMQNVYDSFCKSDFNFEYLVDRCFYSTYRKLIDGFTKCGQVSYVNELNKYYFS